MAFTTNRKQEFGTSISSVRLVLLANLLPFENRISTYRLLCYKFRDLFILAIAMKWQTKSR